MYRLYFVEYGKMKTFNVAVLLLATVCTNKAMAEENMPVPQPTVPPVPVTIHATVATTPIMHNYNQKPPPAEWISYNKTKKDFLLDWLISGCWKECPLLPLEDQHIEYEGYDGFYNNLAHPTLGAIDTPLLRRVPAAYEDGVYQPAGKNRPNPFELSDKLMKGDIGSKSRTGKTALLVFFGQQVVEEILDAQRPACPPEYLFITLPLDHKYRKENNHTAMPFLRTRYDAKTGFSPNNPRQQLNEITPWIDGGLMYGTTKTWADMLRRDEEGKIVPGGELASSYNGLFPARNKLRLPMANPPPPFYHSKFKSRHSTDNVDRFFKLGNPRGNENPFLLVFGVLWFRWHNFLAKYLKQKNSDWSDEKVYNEARKWVIASHQHIVVNEWLPEWLGSSLPEYQGYNPGIDPQIDQLFQSAAFRFGHTLVPPGVYLRDYGRNGCQTIKYNNSEYKSIRTCQHYWRPHESILSSDNNNGLIDIDRLLMGMAFQLCEEEDHKIVDDLRGRVFGPLEFSRRDLMALNIQRGRDHGLPDYNTAREAFNLSRVTLENLANHFNANNMIIEKFKELYKHSLNDVDVWVGGLLETGDGPGELFTAIIKDQFQRIRDGDRFWYKNRGNRLFTPGQIKRLESLKLYDIIMAVTNMEHNDIQIDVFKAPKDKSVLNPNCTDKLHTGVCSNNTCYHLDQLTDATVEECTESATYDYFSSSEVPFVMTFLGLGICILGLFLSIWINAHLKMKKQIEKRKRYSQKLKLSVNNGHMMPHSAYEWVDRNSPLQPVVVFLDSATKQIKVCNQLGNLLRAMDVTHVNIIHAFIVNDGLHIMFRVSNDYDLVLKFDTQFLRDGFLQQFEVFITEVGIARERVSITLTPALKQAITRKDRQKRLEMFFRVVFSQAFNITHSENEILDIGSQAAREIIYTELTIYEFAEALSMRPNSEFVQKTFALVDKDKNGFISFREFLDMLIIFAKGTADDKVKLLFDIYDINGTQKLTREDFKNMLRSLMETVNADVEQQSLEAAIDLMMQNAGLANKEAMDINDFQQLLSDHKDKLGYIALNFSGIQSPQKLTANQSEHRPSFVDCARQTVLSLYCNENEVKTQKERVRLQEEMSVDGDQEIAYTEKPIIQKHIIAPAIAHIFRNYALEIFWITLYTLVMLAIFAERAYYYTVEREHTGLRRIAGLGVTITRGAASAMMFTYSSLLVTMCRNTITCLRDTFLHIYFPFDSLVFIHKYIAGWALVFTVLHTIGHGFNFYSISTQTSDDLTCLFRNYHHSTHEIPKFHYWCWETITGITGILLVILTAIIYTFSLSFARLSMYNAFWATHSLYPLFYIIMICHGSGRLVQEPFMIYFFIGPCILFVLDRMVTVSRKKVEIPVIKADLLPSNVTLLEFKKPNNFEYKSGQWVRIACTGLNTNEYHPFTISSAPHESNLTLHIRAVGPWTTNIRSIYDPNITGKKSLPKIHLEGPYGEGHQDWYKFEVAVLIGGGIGVTPFASILKDIVFRINSKQSAGCNKVYFLWVTKTQKQFEWLVDILREVEAADLKKVVHVHIFITQFYEKFDLRTILLYIFERHFQRVSNRSLFTGLSSVTHFGRPHFTQFLTSVQDLNQKVRKIGVFSCGPPPMTKSVNQACALLNKALKGPPFQHHFKNF